METDFVSFPHLISPSSVTTNYWLLNYLWMWQINVRLYKSISIETFVMFVFCFLARSYKLEMTWMTEKSTSRLLDPFFFFFPHQEFRNLFFFFLKEFRNLSHGSGCCKFQAISLWREQSSAQVKWQQRG